MIHVRTYYLLSQTLLCCLSILLLIASYWQVKRGYHKQSLSSKHAYTNIIPAKKLLKSQSPPSIGKTSLTLSLDLQHFFLIDNQVHQKMLGHTLLAVHHEGPNLLLVDLGWIKTADKAPKTLKKFNNKPLTGIIYNPTGYLWTTHPKNDSDSWPKHLSYLDMQRISLFLDAPVYPSIILSPHARLYQQAQDPNQLGMRAFRHYGYALQFLFFALLCMRYQYYIYQNKGSYVSN